MLPAALLRWAPFAVAITALALLSYGSVQQGYRTSADDPQVQLAEDAVAALNSGVDPTSAVPTGTVDVGSSLAPFVTIAAADGSTLASSGTLNGSAPLPPIGVLSEARANGGENRVTWQTGTGQRFAVVVHCRTAPDNRCAVAGRSLREVEQRESRALQLALGGWVVALVGTYLAVLIGEAVPKDLLRRP